MKSDGRTRPEPQSSELVIITGVSGSGKATVLKCLEDLGYYSVDNLPVDLIPKFAELTRDARTRYAALVVDIREGQALRRFPEIYEKIRRKVPATLLYLEAGDEALVRRFSETRRPHPLGTGRSVVKSIKAERQLLAPIRALADHTIDTSKFNVHELRKLIAETFRGGCERPMSVRIGSFGFSNGIPADSDLIFDVRFLPNPNYIPQFKRRTGKNPAVARYIRSFPQTTEFLDRVSDLLAFLVPHYMREGKSYLTIAFGCTGGQHRSVMIADEMGKRLSKSGFKVKTTHRDMARG